MGSNCIPKIGLALGSGSARGWAHIGVLEELQSMGIPIYAVAGCSIGSLVGGVYALGKLDVLKKWALSLTLRHTAKLLIDPHWGRGGILRGERVFKTLKSFDFDGLIEDLPIPFGAVAADLHTGEEVWLRHGSILEAVRSSAALPGLVKPHYYHNRWFLDGGLVNPVPVALARALGCDYVIAVNLNDHLLKPSPSQTKFNPFLQLMESTKNWLPGDFFKEFTSWMSLIGMQFQHPDSQDLDDSSLEKSLTLQPSYSQVIWSVMNIMQDRITRYRMILDEPDIELAPNLSHLSLLEFHTAKDSIEEGRRAVREQSKQIQALLHGRSDPPIFRRTVDNLTSKLSIALLHSHHLKSKESSLGLQSDLDSVSK